MLTWYKYDTLPAREFALLTPGNGHFVDAEDVTKTLGELEIDGFCMLGAYPNGAIWDFAKGGENEGEYEKVWNVPKPPRDPVMGDADDGLVGLWQQADASISGAGEARRGEEMSF